MNTTLTDIGEASVWARKPRVTYERVIEDDNASEFDGREPYSPDNIVVYVMARARIDLPYGYGSGNTWISIVIESPGVWGVEVADESDPYLDELYREELETLKDMLRLLGSVEPVE